MSEYTLNKSTFLPSKNAKKVTPADKQYVAKRCNLDVPLRSLAYTAQGTHANSQSQMIAHIRTGRLLFLIKLRDEKVCDNLKNESIRDREQMLDELAVRHRRQSVVELVKK